MPAERKTVCLNEVEKKSSGTIKWNNLYITHISITVNLIDMNFTMNFK